MFLFYFIFSYWSLRQRVGPIFSFIFAVICFFFLRFVDAPASLERAPPRFASLLTLFCFFFVCFFLSLVLTMKFFFFHTPTPQRTGTFFFFFDVLDDWRLIEKKKRAESIWKRERERWKSVGLLALFIFIFFASSAAHSAPLSQRKRERERERENDDVKDVVFIVARRWVVASFVGIFIYLFFASPLSTFICRRRRFFFSFTHRCVVDRVCFYFLWFFGFSFVRLFPTFFFFLVQTRGSHFSAVGWLRCVCVCVWSEEPKMAKNIFFCRLESIYSLVREREREKKRKKWKKNNVPPNGTFP